MARQEIPLGNTPTGEGGDNARQAFERVNQMTAELYAADQAQQQQIAALQQADAGLVEDVEAVDARLSTVAEELGVTLQGKVDKRPGYDLSQEDFTSTEKVKLGGIETGAQVNAAAVTQAEAEGGTGTALRSWPVLRVWQAIAAWWAASAMKARLDGIEAGAQVNPVGVSQSEAETGTETGLRSWSPLRIRQAMAAWWASQGLAQVAQANLLINSEFQVNQRGFTGGALAAGSYGHDRWGAYNGGVDYSVSNGTVTLVSGTLCQVIESAGLAGQQVTISVEDPTGALTVTLGNGTGSSSVTGTIAAGSGRRGVTLVVPSAVTGDLKVRVSGAASFKRPKVEVGGAATPWLYVPLQETQAACYRYYYQFSGTENANTMFSAGGTSNNSLAMKSSLPVRMRAVPAATTNITAAAYVAGSIDPNQWSLTAVGVGYTSFTSTPGIIARGGTQTIALYIYGASATPAPNQIALGNNLFIRADAEMACTD